ncbi:MAG: hypothetical protein JW910_07320, partial [Anaerolineae bacterium]|nr:hypothetical protein [Anaerolineae bacterium]
YDTLELVFVADGQTFTVQVDPRRGGGGRLYTSAGGVLQEVGLLGGFSAQGAAVELRLPRLAFTGYETPLMLDRMRFMSGTCCGADWIARHEFLLNLSVPEAPGVDARAVTRLAFPAGAPTFTISGPVGGGVGRWQATGRTNQTSFAPGENLSLELVVTMQAPSLAVFAPDLRLGMELWLEPVIGPGGAQTVADRATGNGWSGLLTASGLAVENVAGSALLGDATAQGMVVDDATGALTFVLQWDLPLPDGLPAGLYVPALRGYAALPGLASTWDESGVLGSGPGAGITEARLPLVLQVGEVAARRLLVSLFNEHPANGVTGLLPEQDAGQVALSGRVSFPAQEYILPRTDAATGEPIAYPLEPYLPAMLSNSYAEAVAPLLPLSFETGTLTVAVTQPDGMVDSLGTALLVQNRLSTAEVNETAHLSPTGPINVYRLTTRDPAFMAYSFTQDGRHEIRVEVTVRDMQGHTYTGGGTYVVWIAETLSLLPGVLPGTPFEVGDTFAPALTVLPAFPADVTLRVQHYPLDGSEPVSYGVEGRASEYGHFFAADSPAWMFETPGEYVVDYTASYTDSLGRLWLGSVRGAGVVASPDASLVARGGRGLANVPVAATNGDRLAWYALGHLLPDVTQTYPAARLHWPYHAGDVLWATDGRLNIQPAARASDTVGDYAVWLVEHLPGWRADDGLAVRDLANEDEVPLVTVGAEAGIGPALAVDDILSQATAYLSAVRPDGPVRQLVLGDETASLIDPGWSLNDPYNLRRGAGINGSQPGDYTFLFSGLVVHNRALDLHEASIYGALAVTIRQDDTRGDRVYPPGGSAASGPDGGALLTIADTTYPAFFVPTSFQPGQVFMVGDVLAVAGQVAPTLSAWVEVDVETPSGIVLPVIGRANAVGYFYDPVQRLPLNEAGIWRVHVRVSVDGLTSAGPTSAPYPVGGVPGAAGDVFELYVLPPDAEPLALTAPLEADQTFSPAVPFNLTANVPAGWSEVQLARTVAMPGFVLNRTVEPLHAANFTYTFSPGTLNQTFNNLDVTVTGTQIPASADLVRLVIVLAGTGADGQPAMQVRVLTIFGSRLVTLTS